jgi:hypothetical protein
LGDRLGEGDDLHRLSHVLSRVSEARKAGRASLLLLEQCGPTPQLAWSLAHMAELSMMVDDPACGDYAARASALGTQLDLPPVVIKANFYAALFRILPQAPDGTSSKRRGDGRWNARSWPTSPG